MLLGQLVGAVNALTLKVDEIQSENQQEFKKINERLDEGDRYLVIIKWSRCSLEWLDRNGFLKYSALAAIFTVIGMML